MSWEDGLIHKFHDQNKGLEDVIILLVIVFVKEEGLKVTFFFFFIFYFYFCEVDVAAVDSFPWNHYEGIVFAPIR